MKSRIFTLLAALSLGWCSCSNEIPAEGDEGQDVTLTASFTSDGMKTKAADDQTISSRFIAAFREGVCTGIAYDNNNTNLKIKAKTGDITFIAIANANGVPGIAEIIANNEKAVPSLPDYNTLKGITAFVTNAADFDKASFIKVTESKKSLVLADSSKTLNFRLFQLPAKVDVKIDVVGQGGEIFDVTKFEVKGINRLSKLVLTDTLQVSNDKSDYATTREGYETAGAIYQDKKGFSFYTYERATSAGNAIIAKVHGTLTKNGVSSEKVYNLEINPSKNSSGGKTDGIVHGWVYHVTGNLNVKTGIEVTIKVVPWDEEIVDEVEFGGDNSNNNNKKGRN